MTGSVEIRTLRLDSTKVLPSRLLQIRWETPRTQDGRLQMDPTGSIISL